MADRKQLSVRVDANFELAMGVLQAVARLTGYKHEIYIEEVLSHFFRKVRASEIDSSHLQQPGRLDNTFRCYLSKFCITELELVAERFDVSIADVFRAAIQLEPLLRWRIEVEKIYIEAGGTGNPGFMSDTFLKLWQRHRNNETNSLEAVVLRHVRPLQMELVELRQQLIGLQEKQRPRHGKPSRSEITSASLEVLRGFASEWGFQIPKKTGISLAKRMALTHFGYATTE